jgi:anthranilate phosphoribosyltransferase
MLAAMETRNTIRGISTEECSDLIRALRTPIEIDMNVLCNSGTGRDRVKTINISTPAAVVIASAGVRVLKNGSRGLTIFVL